MAHTDGPLHSQSAHKRYGRSLIFQFRHGRTHAKAYAAPRNPRTPAQLAARDTTRAIMQSWPDLTQQQRDTWTAAAAAADLDPINFYLKTNWQRIRAGEEPIMSWPPPPPQAPIGSIVAWAKSLANTPALPANWEECNGHTCTASASPYNGQALPNLNGASAAAKRFLRGSATSGAVGGEDSHLLTEPEMPPHAHTIPVGTAAGSTGLSNARFASTTTYPTNKTVPATAHENRPPFYEVVYIIRTY